ASGATTGVSSSNAQLQAMLSVVPTSGLAADRTALYPYTSLFRSTPQAFDYLAVGESLVLSYTVQSTDNNSASDTQTVTVTITGTNDAPDIHLVTSDSAATTLAETNAALGAGGTLTVNDADVSDTV